MISKHSEPKLRRVVEYEPAEYKAIQDARQSVPFGRYVREAALAKAQKQLDEPNEIFEPIQVLGYIPASPAASVCPMPDHTLVHPPFPVPPLCYALLVVGDSMECEYGASIPNGSYAVFCPDDLPQFGAFVHVEWDEGIDRVCTLKRFLPQANGSAIFEPLNKAHKSITRAAGEFEIKGVFRRPWKDGEETK